ncbi:hypothetical protein V1477_016542 [Vespula maculifrons]|uniref:Uncharacterized protein n=1 Tax=Vespula maculifrons TaxID=7453 RepID=A0ABD2B9H5_VESMC
MTRSTIEETIEQSPYRFYRSCLKSTNLSIRSQNWDSVDSKTRDDATECAFCLIENNEKEKKTNGHKNDRFNVSSKSYLYLGLESIATLEYPLAGPHKRSIPCVPPVYDRPKRDEERSKRIFRTVSTTAFRTSPPPPPPPPSPPPPQPLIL